MIGVCRGRGDGDDDDGRERETRDEEKPYLSVSSSERVQR